MKYATFLVIVIFSFSCNKEASFEIEKRNVSALNKENIGFIKNESFMMLYKTFYFSMRNLHAIKDDTLRPLHVFLRAELTRSFAYFFIQNPQFVELNSIERNTAFSIYKQELIKNKSLLVKVLNMDTALNMNNFGLVYSNQLNDFKTHNYISRVSNEELFGCVLEAIGGAIASYGDAINDIRRLISYGYSGRILLDATLDIVSSASPWWKVAGLTISFGACIYSAYD